MELLSTNRPARVSLVLIALNEGDELRQTIASLQESCCQDIEIVVVDDGSKDGCSDCLSTVSSVRLVQSSGLGVAGARNFGARHATGEVVFFADAHTRYPPGWLQPLVELLARAEVGAVAPAVYDLEHPQHVGCGLRFKGPDLSVGWFKRDGSDPHPAPILPGCCIGMRRTTFEETGGFDAGLIRTGSVDNEFGIRFWTLGYELLVHPAVAVGHRFRLQHPYPVQWSTMIHNKLRLALVHFTRRRIERVIQALRQHEAFPAAVALSADSNVTSRRSEQLARRTLDDDWFFSRFSMSC
jgi:glycosyltransferase involved in cell wall biosynthesis